MARPAATADRVAVPAARLRRMALDAQGLLKTAPFGRGVQATRRAIERLGYVQIDTISVVSRAHDHVLHSRVPNYRPDHLSTLQRQRAVFEYWYHAAAYLPMHDYRYALPRMRDMAEHKERWIRSRDKKLMSEVKARVAAEGPLKARDFEHPPAGSKGWWNWKPAKAALEQLFMEGELMVVEREGFQKTYDLRERVLPAGLDLSMPSEHEMAAHLLANMRRSHGFVIPKNVTHLRRGAAIRAALKTLLADRVAGRNLIPISLPAGDTAYADPELLEKRAAPAAGRALLLSPFDNLVIHRERVLSVFDFDYQIECYLKDADRRFGYFCLPLVYRDRLVGRADCKAHRQQRHFEVRHLHVEPPGRGRWPDDEFLPALAQSINHFAEFNGCDRVSVTRTSPGQWRLAVTNALTR